MQIDETIPSNEAVVVMHDNENGPYLLIYITVGGDRNAMKKEAEKFFFFKYKDRAVEMQRMWNVKT